MDFYIENFEKLTNTQKFSKRTLNEKCQNKELFKVLYGEF